MTSRSRVLWRLGVSALVGAPLLACAASREPAPPPADPPPSLALAATCSRPQDCASGVCVQTSKRLLCSTTCAGPADCVAGWTCAPRTDEHADGSSVCTCEPTEDVCDGADNDCDGVVDNGPSADASCTSTLGSTFVCRDANCVCALVCDGRCVDAKADVLNCGACGKSCGAGAQCTEGECACIGETTLCGNSCFDLQRDADNCGACGQACATGATCVGGQCACGLGQTSCGGACADLEADPNNCGACGTVCPAGAGQSATCVSGHCGTTTVLATGGMVSVPAVGFPEDATYDLGTDIVADDDSVYWRLRHRVEPFTLPSFSALLWKLPEAGGAAVSIGEIKDDSVVAPHLAASATELFSFAFGQVFAVPKAGGAARVAVDVPGAAFKTIAVDGGDLFVGPALWRAPVGGGPAESLLPQYLPVGPFALTSTHAYWILDGALGSVPRAGGDYTTDYIYGLPTRPDGAPTPLLSGPDSPYWAFGGGGRIDVTTTPATPLPFSNGAKTGAVATQDESSIYAVIERATVDVVRIAKSTGAVTTVAMFPSGTTIDALATNAQAVFVSLRRGAAGAPTYLPRPSYLVRIEPK